MTTNEKLTAHWMADCLDPDEWPDDPNSTPEDAARNFLAIGGYSNDHCWDSWDDLGREGETKIKARRWEETSELITDHEQQFDGYAPGQTWLKKTDEVVEVIVSLEFHVFKLNKGDK